MSEAGARRIHLGPLTAAAARALAADILGERLDDTAAALIGRAEGNPFYVIELLRAGDKASVPAAGSELASPARIPASIRAAVRAHLRSLPDEAQDLLKVASVLGREFTVTELSALVGTPAGQLAPSLQQALLAEDGDRLSFRHDLLRQAVYHDAPASLRQALHRDAAAALRSAGAPLVRVAGQYAAGARPGDEEAIEVLSAAAGQLYPSSPSAAADMALRVLDLLADTDRRRLALTATAVRILGWAGRLEEARALGEGYLAGHQARPDAEAEIELGVRLAWAMQYLRPYPSPLPARILTDPAVLAATRANLLALEQVGPMWSGDFESADRGFAAAARLATADEEVGDAIVLPLWIYSEMVRGDLVAALGRARGWLDGANREASLVATAYCQHGVALCLAGLGQSREAVAALGLAQQAAHGAGSTLIISQCLQRHGEIIYAQGRLDDARAPTRAAAAAER